MKVSLNGKWEALRVASVLAEFSRQNPGHPWEGWLGAVAESLRSQADPDGSVRRRNDKIRALAFGYGRGAQNFIKAAEAAKGEA